MKSKRSVDPRRRFASLQPAAVTNVVVDYEVDQLL